MTPTDSQGQTFDTKTYNFAPDATPPSAPINLRLSSQRPNILAWAAATDNVGIVAYDVFRNGIYLATLGPQVTTYTDTSATGGVKYTYRVAARDLAGNTTGATVTTGGTADITRPTVPLLLTGSATGYTTASLSWGASTDNIGLLYYTVVRNGTRSRRCRPARRPTPTPSCCREPRTATRSWPSTTRATRRPPATRRASPPRRTAARRLLRQAQPEPPSHSTQVLLSWGASTDNVGVVRYDVLRNGTVVASVAGSSYIDNVAPNSSNTYQVVAYDAAGNSTPSATFAVGTPQSGTVFSDGFETGDLSQWASVNGLTAESSLAHTGAYERRSRAPDRPPMPMRRSRAATTSCTPRRGSTSPAYVGSSEFRDALRLQEQHRRLDRQPDPQPDWQAGHAEQHRGGTGTTTVPPHAHRRLAQPRAPPPRQRRLRTADVSLDGNPVPWTGRSQPRGTSAPTR